LSTNIVSICNRVLLNELLVAISQLLLLIGLRPMTWWSRSRLRRIRLVRLLLIMFTDEALLLQVRLDLLEIVVRVLVVELDVVLAYFALTSLRLYYTYMMYSLWLGAGRWLIIIAKCLHFHPGIGAGLLHGGSLSSGWLLLHNGL
jgi:hypothetical protein